MTDLTDRVAALAARATERDRAKRDDIRDRFPEFAAWADAVRRDLPGKWKAWAVRADGVDMKGGDQRLLTGTYVFLTPARVKVKRA